MPPVQSQASLHFRTGWPNYILLADQLIVLIAKSDNGRFQNGRWNIQFKKFSRLRVKKWTCQTSAWFLTIRLAFSQSIFEIVKLRIIFWYGNQKIQPSDCAWQTATYPQFQKLWKLQETSYHLEWPYLASIYYVNSNLLRCSSFNAFYHLLYLLKYLSSDLLFLSNWLSSV